MTPQEMQLSRLSQASEPPRLGAAALLHRLLYPFRRGRRPDPREATGFYTDTSVCIGCKACEVACKQWNQLPSDGLAWTGNSYDNTASLSATSWRHVKFIEQFPTDGAVPASGRVSLDVISTEPAPARWLMMSDVCKHCATAPCQQSCPTGAILHTEFSSVYIQPDICNGCAYCIAACPFGVITRASFDGHSHKCTLCYDRQRDGLVPACAKACPTASIQFGPLEELRQRARQRVEELHRRGHTSAYLYGDNPSERYSPLHSFYLLLDHPSVYGLPENPVNPWLFMMGDYGRAVAGGLVAILVFVVLLLLLGH